MYRYFAYGSALSGRHIEEWSREHAVDAGLFARAAPAALAGYRLVFDVESRFWGGRVADLIEDASGIVHGALFEMPDSAREAVLRKEGVATGLSEEIDVMVQSEGRAVAAKTFVARPEKRGAAGPASARLLAYLIEGAQERGLPESWVAELRKQETAPERAVAAPMGLPLGRKR